MARRLARRKKTAMYVIGIGALIGVGAAYLIPWIRRRFQQPTITIPSSEITVTPSTTAMPPSSIDYVPGQPINEGALSFLTPQQRTSLEWSS